MWFETHGLELRSRSMLLTTNGGKEACAPELLLGQRRVLPTAANATASSPFAVRSARGIPQG
jgi:hypothetical protein